MLFLIFPSFNIDDDRFLYYDGKASWLLMIIPAILPLAFLIDYSAWLYWYGHNMQDWGAFKVKPFMPTVFEMEKLHSLQLTHIHIPDFIF